ncbi:MAG: pseudouridine synthase [Candidatus Kapabacteria bacterium]|nr:pseudouridine synthase [Candidatus Kapabacteria bacterium]
MIIAFNKPYGMLCQFTPEPLSDYRTLADIGFPSGVYAVGRLDADSEGLLLLSDEKGLPTSLLDPDAAHERCYWVQVDGEPTPSALNTLRTGTMIKGHFTLPCEADVLEPQPAIEERIPPIRIRRSIPTTWISITLIEGKNRQVRRMCAAVGFPALRLIRVRIGGLDAASLSLVIGAWRVLTVGERALLFQQSSVADDGETESGHHSDHADPHQ